MKKKDVLLEQTCFACPEQYDAFINGEEVGYLRLRHGHFRVEYKDEIVYDAYPKGDGIFESKEREHFLNKARKALVKQYNKENE